MEIVDRFSRLNNFIEQGKVVRQSWGDGYESACILSAIVPELAMTHDALHCPESVLPSWVACLTPPICDCGSAELWSAMVRRYAEDIGRAATTFDDAAWMRCRGRFLIAVLDFYNKYVPDNLGVPVVRTLWTRFLAGDPPVQKEWEDARTQGDCIVLYSACFAPGAEKFVYYAAEAAVNGALSDADEDEAAQVEKTSWDALTASFFEAIEAGWARPVEGQ